jgi:acetyl-CoA synthetase
MVAETGVREPTGWPDDAGEGSRRAWWDEARTLLDGLPGGAGINIAHEAVDRHVRAGNGERVALRFRSRTGGPTAWTYADLHDQTSRFANVLAGLGVAPGERVFALLTRTPALYAAALGTLKHRAVLSPLFSSFGPEPVAQRIRRGDGAVLVTTRAFFARKVLPVLDQLPSLRHVLLTAEPADASRASARRPDAPATVEVHDLDELLAGAARSYAIGPTAPDDMALLHFTSGTTGSPKGAVHVHEAVVAHHVTARVALDLHRDDVFWCTADPGWVTGMSYGIIAPLTHGATTIVDEREFDAHRWYQVLQDERVTVLYTAPTALRMLMRAGDELASAYDLSALRSIASVGEPLDATTVEWGRRVLGLPIHDSWWQTETGGIMVASCAGDDVRPGSIGRPLPGVEATVLERDAEGELVLDDSGHPVEVLDPSRHGELALRPGWPSMFRGYLHEPERYARCFVGGWYRTGDLVRRDADGWYWFVGRGDDVIKTAGHLVGPFEVESVLMAHEAVDEAGVIGVPDAVGGEHIKAFVVLAAGYEPGDEVTLDILGFARARLGAAIAPKEVAFVDALPHTRSGKTMRRLLRARELGLDEGDLSMLEGAR